MRITATGVRGWTREMPAGSDTVGVTWWFPSVRPAMFRTGVTWAGVSAAMAARLPLTVTGIWLASRPLGVVAFLWAMAFGAIPRIYAGFHYPSDILGGMVIGILSTLVVAWSPAGTLLSNIAFEIRRRHRGLFYAAAFILSYQVAMIFDEIRRIGTALFKVF